MASSSDDNSAASPASKRRRIDGYSFYGSTQKVPTEMKTLRFEIEDFATLSHKNGQSLETDSVEAFNHLWFARVYPRGYRKEDHGWPACFLACKDLTPGEKIKAKFKFQISQSITSLNRLCTFSRPESVLSFGAFKVASRQKVLESCLVDGNLVIDVHLQIYAEPKKVWYPKQDHVQILSGKKFLESPIGSDVSFSIGDEQEKVLAHKCILFQRAPTIYEFVKDLSPGEDFQVPNITISNFKALLLYIYTGETPKFGDNNDDDDGTANVAKEILLASDRFNLTLLKLHIESHITAKFLKPSTAAEWLFFADAHSCPLLKETCMDVYASNLTEVKASPGWSKVKESSDLLVELLEHFASKNQRRVPSGPDDYENMTVGMLREKLESFNLDLDGTREMLLDRLKNHHESTNEEEKEN